MRIYLQYNACRVVVHMPGGAESLGASGARGGAGERNMIFTATASPILVSCIGVSHERIIVFSGLLRHVRVR